MTLTTRWVQYTAFAMIIAVGAGCSSSSELRDRGGTVAQPTVIAVGGGNTMRIDTQAEQGGRSEALPVSADSAYAKLPTVYNGLGIEVTTMLDAQRTVGNPEVVMRRQFAGQRPSRFFECGAGPTGVPIADTYEIRMSIITQISANDAARSEVTTRVTAAARPLTSAGNEVNCATRGELERRIAQGVRIASAPR